MHTSTMPQPSLTRRPAFVAKLGGTLRPEPSRAAADQGFFVFLFVSESSRLVSSDVAVATASRPKVKIACDVMWVAYASEAVAVLCC
jgi:hypothetical protein